MSDILMIPDLPVGVGFDECFTFCFRQVASLEIYRLVFSRLTEDVEDSLSDLEAAFLSHVGTYNHSVLEGVIDTLSGAQDTLAGMYSQHLVDYHTAVSDSVSPQNSWVNATGNKPLTVTKIAGVVYIDGTISGGTYSNGTVIFTLSEGFRPAEQINRVIACGSNVACRVRVEVDGEVKIYNVPDAGALFLGFSFLL